MIAKNLTHYLNEQNVSAKYLKDLWADSFRCRVNVLGDPIIDQYVQVEPHGLSKGYPCINWLELSSVSFPGGCLKVAADCASQCQEVNIGCDKPKEWNGDPVAEFYPGLHSGRPNITYKVRYVHEGHHVFRRTVEGDVWGSYPPSMPTADVTILSLFGLDGPVLRTELKRLAGSSLVCIDSQDPEKLRQYKDAGFCLFATEDEMMDSECYTGSWKHAFVKDGAEGSHVDAYRIPAFCNAPVDTIGSGDAYLATAAIMLGCYRDRVHEAAILGSISAAIHCSRPGNGTVTRIDIDEVLNESIEHQRA